MKCSAVLFLAQCLVLELSRVSFVSGFQICPLKSLRYTLNKHASFYQNKDSLNGMFPGRRNPWRLGKFVVLAIHSKHPNGGEEDRFMLSKSPFLGRFLPENDVVTYEVRIISKRA